MHLVSRQGAARRHATARPIGSTSPRARLIWTESSYKYQLPAVDEALKDAGFGRRRHWVDDEGQFVLTLASRQRSTSCYSSRAMWSRARRPLPLRLRRRRCRAERFAARLLGKQV